MNKILLIVLLIIGATLNLKAQSLKTSTDEFNGSQIRETSWERIIFDFKSNIVGNSKFKEIDGDFALLLATQGETFGVDNGGELILKFEDKSILKIKAIKLALPSIGGGSVGLAGSSANGVTPIYSISKENIITFSKKILTKIRVYTIDSYIDINIKSRRAKKLMKQAHLIL
jgi:hypothetical protein